MTCTYKLTRSSLWKQKEKYSGVSDFGDKRLFWVNIMYFTRDNKVKKAKPL